MRVQSVLTGIAFAAAAMLSTGEAQARADNAKPGDEDRIETRERGSAATATPPKVAVKQRPEHRKIKRRYILM